MSLAGSEGVKICDLCYCEATPDQVVSQMTEVPKVTSSLSVSRVEELWPPVLLELLATVCED